MKPLPSVLFTAEDQQIWTAVIFRRRVPQGIGPLSNRQDIRDAELMLYLMRKPPHIVRLWVAMRTAVNVNLLFAGRLT